MSLAQLTACLLAFGSVAIAGESDTCRDCQEIAAQKPHPADEMRLRSACVDPLAPDRYCRWVVRAERTGANRAVRKPSAEDKRIQATLSTLKPVQPPQYLGRYATVLALNEAGGFVVVRLEKRENTKESEEWRITEVVEPAAK